MAKLLGGTTIGTVNSQEASSTTSGSLQVVGGVGVTGTVFCTNLTATLVTSISDEKQKDNIITLTNAVNTVQKLRGVEYTWKNTGIKSMGVVAQELEKVLPELVHTTNNGDKSVAYQNMVGLLIEAIKELKAEIDELKKDNK